MKTNKAKNKKPKKTANPKKSKPKAKGNPKPAGKKKPEEIMDRATLKGIAGQLKGAGAEIKVLKGDTDEVLQRKVNEAIQRLPSPEVLKLMESVDPAKLLSVLKQDCLGVFIDLSDVSCVRCPDAPQCVTKFIANVRGGMQHLRPAVGDPLPVKTPEPAKPAAATKYDAKRAVFIRDVPNPNPKGDDYHDTIQRVLDDQPETLGELRNIIEEDFDFDGDADFMKFVTALRDPKEGVIKLDVDLTDKDKAALREAGYEV